MDSFYSMLMLSNLRSPPPEALIVYSSVLVGLLSVVALLVNWANADLLRPIVYMNYLCHPRLRARLKNPRSFFFELPSRNITTATEDGLELHGWHILPAGAESVSVAHEHEHELEHEQRAMDASLARATRVVLYFHGIAGTRGGVWAAVQSARVQLVRALAAHFGAHVVTFDYRGFGDCPGRPSEAGLLADARAAWGWLATASVAHTKGLSIGNRCVLRHHCPTQTHNAPW